MLSKKPYVVVLAKLDSWDGGTLFEKVAEKLEKDVASCLQQGYTLHGPMVQHRLSSGQIELSQVMVLKPMDTPLALSEVPQLPTDVVLSKHHAKALCSLFEHPAAMRENIGNADVQGALHEVRNQYHALNAPKGR